MYFFVFEMSLMVNIRGPFTDNYNCYVRSSSSKVDFLFKNSSARSDIWHAPDYSLINRCVPNQCRAGKSLNKSLKVKSHSSLIIS